MQQEKETKSTLVATDPADIAIELPEEAKSEDCSPKTDNPDKSDTGEVGDEEMKQIANAEKLLGKSLSYPLTLFSFS